MSVRLVFGIMSAIHRPSTVAQLAKALAPHTVVVHHDFSQQADFTVDAPNTQMVLAPKRTGWANWGYSDGILHLLGHCLDKVDFDYFQLLSPTCLPIKPLVEFADYVESGRHQANIEWVGLDDDPQVLMHFAYRTYAPDMSIRYRALWRAYLMYGAEGGPREEKVGLSIPLAYHGHDKGRMSLRARAALGFVRLAQRGWMGRHPFGPAFRALTGGTWFGARREVCEYLVREAAKPRVADYFPRLTQADETLFPTLLGNSPFRIGPSNHLVNVYNGGHPRWFESSDLDRIARSPAWFGRKFPDDASAAVRHAILERIAPRATAV